ncbi:uncharacterized protein BP5553_03409 [Venustampulla echinocandica]|uniref:Uncharacterized protein n=1 Tax=Venustampulla echinocandica TaxID=2656787 RepID=A0A370TU75_9HELO|nr:uncharacterized protein BP5553_03409 [Venustampulla echinocandica]RDL39069.1 hypothetical protein BP5553_03409 [Venustampulla echinocandica]
MNWTGGHLQRHFTRIDPLKHRQQQHFARAKAKLLSAKKSAPVKIPCLDRIHGLHTGIPTESRFPASSLQERSCSRENVVDSQSNGPFPPITHTILQGGAKHSIRREPIQHHPSVPMKPERVPSADLYNATPPPIPKKVKRERKPSIPESGEGSDTEHEESLSDKRRKILLKGDWVSVGFQRPPQLTFTNPKHADAVGKRRKVTDGHQAQYTRNARRQTISPNPIRNLRQLSQSPSLNAGQLPRRPDVKISIGGKVFPPGISSGSAPSRKRSILSLPPPSNSSEVMLLGNEEIQPGTDDSSNYYGNLRIEGLTGDRNTRNEASWYAQTLLSNNRAGNINHGYRGSSNREPDEDAEVTNNFPDGLSPSFQMRWQFLGNEDDSHTSDGLQSSSLPNSDSRNTPRHPRPIFSSSSASLHHPLPKSYKISSLLETDTSEMAKSTTAEVGRVKSSVPASQIMDNKVWETWMTSFQNDDGLDGIDETLPAENRSVLISPKISAAPEYGPRDGYMDSGDGDPSESESPEPYQHKEILECDSSLWPALGQSSCKQLQLEPRRQLQEREPQMNLLASSPLGGRDWIELRVVPENTHEHWTASGPKAANFPTSPAPKLSFGAPMVCMSTEKKGPDEIWKQFVFGSDSEEVDIFHDQGPKNTSHGEAPDTISLRTDSPIIVGLGISVATSGYSLHSLGSDSDFTTGYATKTTARRHLSARPDTDTPP